MRIPQARLVRLLPNGQAEDALDGRPLGTWNASRLAAHWRISLVDAETRRRWIAFLPWRPPDAKAAPQTVLMRPQAPGL
jgi:hypothetical protein